jgi:hypothetical protein
VRRIWQWFIGCKHRHTSFPITLRMGLRKQTYVVCTDCGCKFAYDWAHMKVLKQ